MVYVRGAAKAHGMARQVEGRLAAGQRVVVVEDLITTGGSALNTADVLLAAGAAIPCCLAIFSYDLERARHEFARRNIPVAPLTTLPALLQVAVAGRYITADDAGSVSAWAKGLEHG